MPILRQHITLARPWHNSASVTTAHCTILVADVERFSARSRTNTNQVRIRNGLYDAMQGAFDASGLQWASCRHEDRGDGVFVLAPATTPKVLLAEFLPDVLVSMLHMHNTRHSAQERIRLRLAVHAGEIKYDDHGVTATSINDTFRLVEAPELKAALARSSNVLAIASSSWFFDEVIRHHERCQPESYRRVRVNMTDVIADAWIRTMG